LPVKNKTILLKTNLVGLDPQGVMNTHPAVIAATRESFLKLGAARVMIGDGPALDRDTHAILESVRPKEFTGKLGKDFCLNVADVKRVPLETPATRLEELFLPKTVLGVDFLVSMPKLKTPSLGRRHSLAEKYVRYRTRQLLRLAEKRAALGRH
jgi:uncharacterized protein (DUF362 family)